LFILRTTLEIFSQKEISLNRQASYRFSCWNTTTEFSASF